MNGLNQAKQLFRFSLIDKLPAGVIQRIVSDIRFPGIDFGSDEKETRARYML